MAKTAPTQSHQDRSHVQTVAELEKALLESVEAEQSVLGSVLVDTLAMSKAAEVLKPDHFAKPYHAEIYAACLALVTQGEKADIIAVSEVLEERKTLERVGGRSYINELAMAILSTENVDYHIGIIHDRFIRRNGHRLCLELASMAGDASSGLEYIEQAQAQLADLAGNNTGKTKADPLGDLLGGVLEDMHRRQACQGELSGIATGFYDLDDQLSGLQRGDLLILAARPSMGKTALCLNIATHVAFRENKPVLFFSLEMSKQQLAQRVLCSEAKIDAQRVRSGNIGPTDFQNAQAKKIEMAEAPLYIDDSSKPGVAEMQAKARQLALKLGQPLGLIVIDYLQLMDSPSSGKKDFGNRVYEIAAITRGLKGLAKEMDCPVLCLSQLSRALETRQDKRPMLSDLRESGSIEQDADVVMFIYRDEYYNPETDRPGMADIIIAKQRNGPVNTIPLIFRNSITCFINPIKSSPLPF